MDVPNDNKLLNMLLKYKNNEESTNNLSEYSLTSTNCIKQVSKSITDIIYTSFLTRSESSQENRLISVALLQQLINCNSHFIIDESNYSCFVKALLETKDGIASEKCLTNEDNFLKPINHWHSICETVDKKYKSNVQSKIKSNLLDIYQMKQFQNLNFEFNALSKSYQSTDFEKTLEFFQNLPDSCESSDLSAVDDSDTNKEVEKNPEIYCKLVLSLIKLESTTSDTDKLFIRVIQDLSKCKTEKIIQFIDCIWGKYQKNECCLSILKSTNILIYFSHIYEKLLLNLFTEILTKTTNNSNNDDYELIINKVNNLNSNKILKTCSYNKDLLINLSKVFDQLLLLGNYDNRILKTINMLKSSYFN